MLIRFFVITVALVFSQGALSDIEGKLTVGAICQEFFLRSVLARPLGALARQTEHTNIPLSKKSQFGFPIEAVTEESENSVFIGIAPEGHAYMVVRGKRLDGGFRADPTLLREWPYLSNGIVIQISDEDGVLAEKLSQFLNAKNFGVSNTCVDAVDNVLDENTDLFFGGGTSISEFCLPGPFIEQILKEGVRSKSIEELTVTVYTLGDDSLESILKQIRYNPVVNPLRLLFSEIHRAQKRFVSRVFVNLVSKLFNLIR